MQQKKSLRDQLPEAYYDPPKSTEYPEEFFKLMDMILPRSDVAEIIKKKTQESNQSIEVNVPNFNPYDDDPCIEVDDLIDVHAELGAINV